MESSVAPPEGRIPFGGPPRFRYDFSFANLLLAQRFDYVGFKPDTSFNKRPRMSPLGICRFSPPSEVELTPWRPSMRQDRPSLAPAGTGGVVRRRRQGARTDITMVRALIVPLMSHAEEGLPADYSGLIDQAAFLSSRPGRKIAMP